MTPESGGLDVGRDFWVKAMDFKRSDDAFGKEWSRLKVAALDRHGNDLVAAYCLSK